MDKQQVTYDLNLFIEKADKLRESKFVKNAIAGSGVNLSSAVGKVTTITRTGPDDENIDAFVLTFRFFIQDNDSISLRKFKDIFHSSFAEKEETEKFDEARDHLNTFLDENTMFNINGMIKRRDLMDIFIYGGLSHANKEKKEKYDKWMSIKILAPFMQNEFIVVLFEALNVIVFIRNLADAMLKKIET